MSDISDYTILIKSGQFLQKNTAIHYQLVSEKENPSHQVSKPLRKQRQGENYLGVC
jgi:hypothetical protein